jgi:peptidoglycan DL-endopeptidase CwlO
MRRSCSRRLLGVAGGTLALLAATLAAAVPAASADPLLDQKQAQYRSVKDEVRALDLRSEQLTEQYNRAVWRLKVLHGQIRATDRAMVAAHRRLVREQHILSELLVQQYKGGDPKVLEIVFGARSLAQVTNGFELQRRFESAVADTVDAIRSARAAIKHQRLLLVIDRAQVRKQKRVIAARKAAILRQLALRRALEKELGQEVTLLQAASRFNQSALALHIRDVVKADMKAARGDAGQVLRDKIVLEGLDQIGVPYVWGGATPEGGFDCSGLVSWLWAQHGYSLPHFAAAQYHLGPVVENGPAIDVTTLRPGDLLFFHDLGHVGIYAGDGYLLHAPHTGTVVQLAKLSEGWFQSTFVGATQPGPA